MQRVGLAQALLGDPEIVFLDEPTSGLDPLGRMLVRDVIRELRHRGTTVFLNSHLLGEVEATCSRVVFVKEGRVIHDMRVGETKGGLEVEIRSGTMTREARAAIEKVGRVLGDGASSAVESGDSHASLRLSILAEDRIPEIARTLVERGIPIYEIRVKRKSLETWFLDVMGEGQRPG
jgi:ABC-2 type transport system ATP-binding protein